MYGPPEIEEYRDLDLDMPLNQHFNFLATIGKGAYGSVYLVENNLCPDQVYAIKSVKEKKSSDTIE